MPPMTRRVTGAHGRFRRAPTVRVWVRLQACVANTPNVSIARRAESLEPSAEKSVDPVHAENPGQRTQRCSISRVSRWPCGKSWRRSGRLFMMTVFDVSSSTRRVRHRAGDRFGLERFAWAISMRMRCTDGVAPDAVRWQSPGECRTVVEVDARPPASPTSTLTAPPRDSASEFGRCRKRSQRHGIAEPARTAARRAQRRECRPVRFAQELSTWPARKPAPTSSEDPAWHPG